MNPAASFLTVILKQVDPLPLLLCHSPFCYCNVLTYKYNFCIGAILDTRVQPHKARRTFLRPVTKVKCGETSIFNPVTEMSPEERPWSLGLVLLEEEAHLKWCVCQEGGIFDTKTNDLSSSSPSSLLISPSSSAIGLLLPLPNPFWPFATRGILGWDHYLKYTSMSVNCLSVESSSYQAAIN